MWVQMLKKIQPKTPAPYTHLAVTEAWRNTTQDKTPPAQVLTEMHLSYCSVASA